MTSSSAAPVQSVDPRQPRRVRHEAKRRVLTVARVDRLTPHMVRVTLKGEELAGFNSASFDDHIKLFFPEATPTEVDVNGQPKPVSRDYTPRRHDPAAGTLEIEFALHTAGPATAWATQAAPGQTLNIGGPRGSFVIPTAYDWHLFIGDDTALPAIARRLSELPKDARAIVVAEVDDAADEMAFESGANVSTAWVHRKGAEAGATDLLSKRLRTLTLPAGDYYAWVACESLTAKALRAQLIAENGANPKWIRASGYWRRGTAAVHETFED